MRTRAATAIDLLFARCQHYIVYVHVVFESLLIGVSSINWKSESLETSNSVDMITHNWKIKFEVKGQTSRSRDENV